MRTGSFHTSPLDPQRLRGSMKIIGADNVRLWPHEVSP